MGELLFGDCEGSALVGGNDGPDSAHRLVNPVHRLPIAGFKLARTSPRFVKLGCQSRAVDVEDMDLLGERTTSTFILQALLQGSIERVKRIDYAFDSLTNSACALRYLFWSGHVLTTPICSAFCPFVQRFHENLLGRVRFNAPFASVALANCACADPPYEN
jgi:hypothetical protein